MIEKSSIALWLAIGAMLCCGNALALFPVSFKSLGQKADKIALVEIVELNRVGTRVKIVEIFKGRFRKKEIRIWRPRFLWVLMSKQDRQRIAVGVRCLVLLDFSNGALSPFTGSACGGYPCLILDRDRVYGGVYARNRPNLNRPGPLIRDLRNSFKPSKPPKRQLDYDVEALDLRAAGEDGPAAVRMDELLDLVLVWSPLFVGTISSEHFYGWTSLYTAMELR